MNTSEPITTEELIKAAFGTGMIALGLKRDLDRIRNLPETPEN